MKKRSRGVSLGDVQDRFVEQQPPDADMGIYISEGDLSDEDPLTKSLGCEARARQV
jgi:hypothetical protein